MLAVALMVVASLSVTASAVANHNDSHSTGVPDNANVETVTVIGTFSAIGAM